MCLRMPQGYSAAGDPYTHRYDEIIVGVERKVKIIDDTLLYDESIEQHFYHVWDYLTLCAKNGIIIHAKKFQFCKDTVDFTGLTITADGVVPSEKMLSAITDFPPPTDLTSARAWFGLVNQVSWAYAVSPIMQPFRDLIKPNQQFYWNDNLEMLFESSKNTIISLVKDGIKSFDLAPQTCIQPDWSKEGIGYLLLQKHCQCTQKSPVCCKDGWKLIFASSRFTNNAESNYSPTEGEALALSWALKHSRIFSLGCPNLFVATDHKPLLGIFNDRDLGSILNPRVQNLKEGTLPWRFSTIHCPGKWTRGPDALSQYPGHTSTALAIIHEHPSDTDNNVSISTNDAVQVAGIYAVNEIGNVTFDHILTAARADAQYQDLLHIITIGFPKRCNETEPAHLGEFWKVRHRLSVFDGVALLDQRLVIPRSLRSVILNNLHSANQGVTGMRFRANQCVYWAGLDSSIRKHRATCRDCIRNAPSQPPEPLILTPSPTYPFEQICADYFTLDTFHISPLSTGSVDGSVSTLSKTMKSIVQPYRRSLGTYLWPMESLRNSAQTGALSSCQRAFRIFSSYGESSTGYCP